MQEVLEMLKSIFITKRVSSSEQADRYNEIFDETETRHLFLR